MSIVLNNRIFIEISIKNHKNKEYDYSLVNYKTARTKVCIICKNHGKFWQRADSHMKGANCQECAKIEGINKIKLQQKEFLERAYKIHNNFYDYSLSNCESSRDKIKIICKIHGEFIQSVHNHLQGSGCPKCQCLSFSSGELRIKNWLNKENINFISQKKFGGCKNKRCLPFDFYIPDYNTCIEYDGKQHFDKRSKFYSEDLINNDDKKNKYCKSNKINLIRISFQDFSKIENILENKIGGLNG